MRFVSNCFLFLTLLAACWIGFGVVREYVAPPSPGTTTTIMTQDSITVRESAPDPFPTIFFIYTGVPVAIGSLVLGLVFYAFAEAERRHEEMLAVQLLRGDPEFRRSVDYRQPAQLESRYQEEWQFDDEIKRSANPIKRGDRIITQPKTRKPGEYNIKGQRTDEEIDKIRRYKRLD